MAKMHNFLDPYEKKMKYSCASLPPWATLDERLCVCVVSMGQQQALEIQR